LDNAARIAENGLGVRLHKNQLTEEKIYNAIIEVIKNKRLEIKNLK
jgi:UDP:flavonoid glycosyltransferase YjiC (YdhE family)